VLTWFSKRKNSAYSYPHQFWLLFGGMFINRMSVSMMWPFLTVYMYNTLDLPLATVTLLLSVRAVFSVVSTTIVSPIMDHIGRKGIMILSLIASTVVFVGMANAHTLPVWILLVAGHGMVLPIFNIGVQTMVADLVPNERRAPAYALIRTVANAGIAIGPVIGGVLALIAFEVIFYITAIFYVILAGLVLRFIEETKPEHEKAKHGQSHPLLRGSYASIIKDYPFVTFLAAYFVLIMAFSNLFSLMPVYLSENFGFIETQYSLLLSLNAAMVVFLQFAVTKYTARFGPYTVITIGAGFYALGLCTVIFGTTLPHFLLSMAIATIGELMVMPTASTLVAAMAPDNMRARYMGLLTLGWPIGSGIGPVLGGFLNDAIAPVAIWYGATAMALIGVFGFMLLARIQTETRAFVTKSA